MNTSESAQDSSTSHSQELPEEFRYFREAVLHRPTDSTLDGKVEEWAYILAAWRQHLAHSRYRKHALKLLLPILDSYSGLCFQRYQEKGSADDLELTLRLYEEAVRETTQDSDDLLRRLEGLGLVQGMRYNQTKDLTDLDAILQTLKRAAELVASTSTYPQYLYFIGEYYKERYRLTRSSEDLTLTIEYLQDSVDRETSRKKVDALYLLGFMFRERYSYSDNNEDLKLAIDTWHAALDLMKLYEPDAPGLLENIGATFAQYYELSQSHAALEEAIPFWQRITAQLSRHSPILSACYTFLSYCCFMRYVYTDEMDNLNQAIEASEKAVELSLPNSEEHIRNLNNLGNTLKARYGVTAESADLNRAEQCFAEAEQMNKRVPAN
ncbi:hypothetical protein [Tengunoibacter tsumagoiensis]|uniref:Tetratricopeptide repeat protein n=1 Tax=Tengunoibacter tsumagoiensis TaxID=2014871 RepID=A0A402AAD4_9CHLR|nr:hypothetical protein [Tengunoibacter tsumagoiensis]GCE15881.1 hypothetical protein KTT_57400 [Tengunoibacter tsumagoiensis]